VIRLRAFFVKMDLFISRFDRITMEIKMNNEQASLLAFLAGVMWSLIILSVLTCCTAKKDPHETAGDLFEAEHQSVNEDDFREFIIMRLAQSFPFRSKMVNGMAKLHETHPKIYAQVMRN